MTRYLTTMFVPSTSQSHRHTTAASSDHSPTKQPWAMPFADGSNEISVTPLKLFIPVGHSSTGARGADFNLKVVSTRPPAKILWAAVYANA